MPFCFSRSFVSISALLGVLALSACGHGLSSVVPPVSSGDSSALQSVNQSTALQSVSQSTTAAGISTYSSAVLSGSPIAYYMLHDSSATLVDSGAHHFNGVYGSAVRHGGVALTSGAASSSAVFPGLGAGAAIAPNSGVVPANASFATAQRGLTVEAWIRPNSQNKTNNIVPIVSYGREAQGQAWVLQVNPQSMLNFWTKTSTGNVTVKAGTTVLQAGQTYHVVATYDGSTARVYVNGGLEGSTSKSGSINYSGITSQYGLSVGAALGSTLPIFAGDISDVAVYGSALSASQVQQHYVNGQVVATLNEVPTSSDGFVDSIGVVTHATDSSGPYVKSWPTFQALLTASGIRHIRDALGGPTWYLQHLTTLAQSGIHSSLDSNFTQSSSTIAALAAQYAPSIEAVNGPNEPDLIGGSGWVSKTRAFQQMLWSTVKNNPALAHLSVLGPPLTSQANELALGNLSAYMNYGSMHDYFDAFNPGTPGWGSTTSYGTYGSIRMNINVAAIISGTRPIIATETGYGDGPGNPNRVDDRTLGRYVPRIYLEHFLAGVPRTMMFEFYDEQGGVYVFQDFGLIRGNNTPKPSYTVIKNLIGLLADPGAPFTPARTSYVIGGNTNHLHHLLLRKRNGTYELVLWLEVPSFNPTTKTDISVPAQTVTVQPPSGVSAGTFSTFDDLGNLSTARASLSGGTFSVPVDDRVSVLTMP